MNGFEDDGARALCDAIRGNNTLTELNIRNNRISTVGAAHIARGLEGNNTLEVLKVRTVNVNKEENEHVVSSGCELLKKAN
jgi:hypothetical protein